MTDNDVLYNLKESLRTELQKSSDELIDELASQFVSDMKENRSRIIAEMLDCIEFVVTENNFNRIVFQINIKGGAD